LLSKKFRLNRRQIDFIYQRGRSRNFGLLGVKFLANRLTFARFAVVIPQKVVKEAVKRNRLRRGIFDEIGRTLKEIQTRNIDLIIRLYRPPEDEKILRTKIREVLRSV